MLNIKDITNTVICGDCLEVMKSMPDNCVDLVLTDIPYGKVNREDSGLRVLSKGNADIETFDLSEFIDECVRIASGSIYVFCGTEQVSQIRHSFVASGLSPRLIIWEKTNPTPMNGQYLWLSGIECCVYGRNPKATFNSSCRNTVLRYPSGQSKIHPTQKPRLLFKDLLKTSSHEGDLVFDPCCGSGTTCIESELLGRNYIGIEISPEYCAIARKRIQEAKDSMGLFKEQ